MMKTQSVSFLYFVKPSFNTLIQEVPYLTKPPSRRGRGASSKEGLQTKGKEEDYRIGRYLSSSNWDT